MKGKVQSVRTVTLQILRFAPASNGMPADQDAARLRRGDIVDVVLTPPNATRDGNDWHWDGGVRSKNLGFVHMRDVPEARWQNMRVRFTEGLTRNNLGSAEDPDDKVDSPDGTLYLAREKRWRFQIPQMANAKRDQLLNDGETTYAWDAARLLIVRKQFTDKLDPSQDTSHAVTDADLPGAETQIDAGR